MSNGLYKRRVCDLVQENAVLAYSLGGCRLESHRDVEVKRGVEAPVTKVVAGHTML